MLNDINKLGFGIGYAIIRVRKAKMRRVGWIPDNQPESPGGDTGTVERPRQREDGMDNKQERILESLVSERDARKMEMLKASPNQLKHSWLKWGRAGEIQAQIDYLLAATAAVSVADRFLRRKATISELRAAVKAAKGE